MSNLYDIVIIGGGVSGLYARWRLSIRYPNLRILLLEKKPFFGGRIKQRKLGSTTVQLGAGVIRSNKDTILMGILSEIGLTTSDSISKGQYCFRPSNFKETMRRLSVDMTDTKGKSFEHWITERLGQKEADRFITTMGYTDMIEADAEHTMRYYGLEDNDFSTQHSYSFINGGWMALINRLLESGHGDALTSSEVLSLSKTADGIIQVSTFNQTISCRRLLICTTAMFFRNTEFVGSHRPDRSLDHIPTIIETWIGSVPFVRIYVKLDGPLSVSMSDILVVADECRKIIPINRKDGVLMLVYSDSQDALHWKRIMESKSEADVKRELTSRLRKHGICNREVITYLGTFWSDGIHYFKPLANDNPDWLSHLRNPSPNVFIGGEMVATRQGWVNGTLECIDEILESFAKVQ